MYVFGNLGALPPIPAMRPVSMTRTSAASAGTAIRPTTSPSFPSSSGMNLPRTQGGATHPGQSQPQPGSPAHPGTPFGGYYTHPYPANPSGRKGEDLGQQGKWGFSQVPKPVCPPGCSPSGGTHGLPFLSGGLSPDADAKTIDIVGGVQQLKPDFAGAVLNMLQSYYLTAVSDQGVSSDIYTYVAYPINPQAPMQGPTAAQAISAAPAGTITLVNLANVQTAVQGQTSTSIAVVNPATVAEAQQLAAQGTALAVLTPLLPVTSSGSKMSAGWGLAIAAGVALVAGIVIAKA